MTIIIIIKKKQYKVSAAQCFHAFLQQTSKETWGDRLTRSSKWLPQQPEERTRWWVTGTEVWMLEPVWNHAWQGLKNVVPATEFSTVRQPTVRVTVSRGQVMWTRWIGPPPHSASLALSLQQETGRDSAEKKRRTLNVFSSIFDFKPDFSCSAWACVFTTGGADAEEISPLVVRVKEAELFLRRKSDYHHWVVNFPSAQ